MGSDCVCSDKSNSIDMHEDTLIFSKAVANETMRSMDQPGDTTDVSVSRTRIEKDKLENKIKSKLDCRMKETNEILYINPEEFENCFDPSIVKIVEWYKAFDHLIVDDSLFSANAEINPILFKNGEKYRGGWSLSLMREGLGVFYNPDKHNPFYYEGGWHNDMPEGIGLLVRENSMYSGEFEKGKISGQGIYIEFGNKHNKCFEGKVEKVLGSFPDMHSEILSSIGLGINYIYEGEFSNGAKSGEGSEYLNNGSHFVGQFCEDQRIYGKYSFSSNATFEGHFNKDSPVEGKIIFPNHDTYEGNISEGKFQGKGIYCWDKNKSVYNGSYFNNKKVGKGSYYSKSSNVQVSGNWINGDLNGNAEIIMGGLKYNSLWRFNKLINQSS